MKHRTFCRFFSIDMATDERKSLKSMLTARWGHSTITLDGSIYVIGGYDENRGTRKCRKVRFNHFPSEIVFFL